MRGKLISVIAIFSLLINCTPIISTASTEENWIISNFSQSDTLMVTDKSCVDGVVTLRGISTGGGEEYVAATAYNDLDIQDAETLAAIGQTTTDSDGNFELSFGLAAGTQKGVINLCSSTSDSISAIFLRTGDTTEIEVLEKMRDKLNTLVKKCDAAGIPIDYARVKATVVDKFTQFLNDDLAKGNSSRLSEHYSILSDMYTEACAELQAYLSGDKIPQSVPRYVTSENADRIDGVSVFSDTVQDGTITERPTFYVGYGHWDYAEESVDYFDDLGVNFLHAEIGPQDVLFHADPAKDWNFISGGFLREGSKIELVNGAGISGSNAIRIVNTTPPDSTSGTHPYGWLGISQTVSVEPNKTYNYSFNIKGSGIDTAASYYQIGNGDRKRFSATEYGEYTKVSGTYTTGIGETAVTFKVVAENLNTEILLDDVKINKIYTETNLFLNHDFEGGIGDDAELRDGFKIGYSEINRLKNVLKKAEDNNVAVTLLLDLHYFPSFVTAEDSSIDNNGKIYTAFMPVNPTHPRVKQVLELFAKIVMEQLGEYRSLQSVVIANEPAFNAGLGENGTSNAYYLPQFREFLKNKYGTIDKLNQFYGTSYASFESIDMPAWGNIRKADKNKLTIDYITFNDKIVYDFHAYVVNAVKSVVPDIKVQTKIMAYLHETTENEINVRSENGNEYESLSELMDLNGCDGGAAPNSTEINTLEALLQWYDFQRSVNEAPMFNLEDHSISGDYSEKKADWIYGYLWQGAVHGRGGTALWRWTRDEQSLETFEPDTNYAIRPRETAAVGKACLDLNRLSEEITAIQNRKARIALFYSDKSNCWNNNYLNALYQSYCEIIYTGQKVDFITENAPEKLNVGEYDLLIMPYATHVPETVLNEIIAFKNKGGKVLLTEVESETALAYDSYGDSHSQSLKTYARNGCEIARYASEGSWWNGDWKVYDSNGTVRSKISEMIRSYVKDANTLQVKDASTGELVSNVEYGYANDKNGDTIINIYSYEDNDSKDVKIYFNGEPVSSSIDLISGTAKGEVICLKSYTPLLLNISNVQKKVKTEISLGEVSGMNTEIKRYRITSPASGTVIASCEIPENTVVDGTEVLYIVVVEDGDGRMIGCSMDKQNIVDSTKTTMFKAVLDVGEVTENTKVKAFVWANALKPLCEATLRPNM